MLRQIHDEILEIAELMESLQFFGHLSYSSHSETFKSSAPKVLQELLTEKDKLAELDKDWKQTLSEARRKHYALNLISPFYFSDLVEYLRHPKMHQESKIQTLLAHFLRE